MRPSGFSSFNPRSAIWSCSGWSPRPEAVFHLPQIFGCFLIVPSPEQGTSHNTRSKNPFFLSLDKLMLDKSPVGTSDTSVGKSWPKWVVIMRSGELMRLHWWTSIYALWSGERKQSPSAAAGRTKECDFAYCVIPVSVAIISQNQPLSGSTCFTCCTSSIILFGQWQVHDFQQLSIWQYNDHHIIK